MKGKPWRSGFCTPGNPADSHARCDEHPRSDAVCGCECHAPAAVEGLFADLPNDEYHGLTDWLSSTQLKRALPEYYKEGGSQEALDFGTLVHSVVLEPGNLDHYVPADAEVIGVKADGTRAEHPTMTKAWKTFVAAQQDGKTIVALDDWDRAHRMRDAVMAHGEAHELLFGSAGVAEESAFVTDADGIQHKARFDRRIDGEVIDLKTTSGKPGAFAMTRTILDYGYELSAAHYLEVAELLDLGIERFTWVFVGKTAPYRVTVIDVEPEFIERGGVLRQRAIDRLTDPSIEPYEGATGRLRLSLPPWARLTSVDAAAGIPSDFTWSPDDYS